MPALYAYLPTVTAHLRDRLTDLHDDETGALNTSEIALLLAVIAGIAIAFGAFLVQYVAGLQSAIPGS